MSAPIRTLPIVEHWDCHGCGVCCRTTTILLDRHDLAQLRVQAWDTSPEFHGRPTVVRESLLAGRLVLAKQPDGSCVFLTDQGRCRIHEVHGAEAKPAMCRIFPLQPVPLREHINLTLRFGCPSAAAGRGRDLREHLTQLRQSRLVDRFAELSKAPPPIRGKIQRDWTDYLRVADTLMRITVDEKLPLVRRLVHGLQFCSLLEQCQLARLDAEAFRELLELLETSAPAEAGDFFHERRPPNLATAFLFRQAALHFIRAHPRFPQSHSWRRKCGLLWATTRMARGGGRFPRLHPDFPDTTFRQLDEPLGPLPADVWAPLVRFFVSNATSKHYAIVGHRRALVDSYRALALNFPMALWLLRLITGKREATVNDMVDVVTTIDRAQGAAAISRSAHLMASSHALERLITWYVL